MTDGDFAVIVGDAERRLRDIESRAASGQAIPGTDVLWFMTTFRDAMGELTRHAMAVGETILTLEAEMQAVKAQLGMHKRTH